MQKEIMLSGRTVSYTLNIKNVKNINLRIKPDGSITVSANRFVPQKTIEDFLVSKSDFILKAVDKYKNRAYTMPNRYFTDEELKQIILGICNNIYPYFKQKGIDMPVIRFRKMKSRWGSCHPSKKILTFNMHLSHAPYNCIEYVVYHEFTHFLQANHSLAFYHELSKICPQWKERRKELKNIVI